MVCLETVSTVPVSTAFNEGFRPVNVLFDVQSIAEEYTDADYGEDEVNFSAEDAGLFEDSFVG